MIVIFVPEGTFAIVHIFPVLLVTVPAVLVTAPPLTVTPREYVRISAEHATGVVISIVGNAFTVAITNVLVGVVHVPEVASI